jgi:hypothetical protein
MLTPRISIKSNDRQKQSIEHEEDCERRHALRRGGGATAKFKQGEGVGAATRKLSCHSPLLKFPAGCARRESVSHSLHLAHFCLRHDDLPKRHRLGVGLSVRAWLPVRQFPSRASTVPERGLQQRQPCLI